MGGQRDVDYCGFKLLGLRAVVQCSSNLRNAMRPHGPAVWPKACFAMTLIGKYGLAAGERFTV